MELSGDVKSLRLTLIVYVIIFAMKLTIYSFTGVIVLLAEALHTLSDIFVSSFLLVAAVWSRKKADQVHMFGYGKAQNVAALVAATLFISFTSYKLYEESIPRLFKAGLAVYQNLNFAIGVIIATMLLAAVPLLRLFRQKTRGAAAKAQFLEIIHDELGLLAALAGTILIIRGVPIADPIAAIAVATLIAYNAVGLFRENLSFLLGRSPGPEYLAKIESLVRSVAGVRGIHDLRAEYIGPETIHTGFHIEVDRGTSVEEADRIAEEVQETVHKETGCQYCFIHMDPAQPKTERLGRPNDRSRHG